ncbi:MAG: pyridoxamine 5'-phosphate oxidase family protein [Planctomycetes bacterium]|jgi:hypothetical protein|nr:pyridoxamine 5'-phosphate oxidase family protein [Planctomycetota bacterium]
MNLKDYFNRTQGVGVLATSDADGNVDAAVYAVPHVVDENTLGFIMRPRRSFNNILKNPKAAYLFLEKTDGYNGLRLYLEKCGLENNPDKINQLRRSRHGGDEERATLVYFKVTEQRPLVGDKEK